MSHQYDEAYSVYDNLRVRARKFHRCEACGETIQPGHLYHSVRIVFQGTAETVKRCLRCEAIHAHLVIQCRASYDAMWPSERLDCGENYEDHWGTKPPEDIAALAFITADEMQAEMQASSPLASPKGPSPARKDGAR